MFIQKEVNLKPGEKYLTHIKIKHDEGDITAYLSCNIEKDITFIYYNEGYGTKELGNIITETYRYIEERNSDAGIPKSFYLKPVYRVT